MSGHSHAANIAVKKAKTDAAKGKIFTKVGREIAVAAKSNPDPSTNSKLADAIAKARSVNMPNENIKRCIAKAAVSTAIYTGVEEDSSRAVMIPVLTALKSESSISLFSNTQPVKSHTIAVMMLAKMSFTAVSP